MSSRQSFRPSMAARAGCERPSSAWTQSVPRRPSRSRAHAPSGCGSPSGAWRRSSPPSSLRTMRMRLTARVE
jgi:hypothetical protein